MTNEDLSIVPYRHLKKMFKNQGLAPIDEIKKIDQEGYYKMNVMTYLIGDSDKHDGNWGLLRDNDTGNFIRLHPLFDFNCAFENYNKEDGGWCVPEIEVIEDAEDGWGILLYQQRHKRKQLKKV
ncbi:MAG: hypothetical protein RR444_07510 [Oscillospiraceae bacterium]